MLAAVHHDLVPVCCVSVAFRVSLFCILHLGQDSWPKSNKASLRWQGRHSVPPYSTYRIGAR